MEPIAERAWGRQHHSSHLSTVGGDGRLAPKGEPWWRGAKTAWTGNGRRQTEPWACSQPYGPWQGWYQAQSVVDGEGGPLSIVVAGANVTMPSFDPRHVVDDHSPPRRNPNTSGPAVGLPPDTAIVHASARRSWTLWRKRYPARRWVVERTLASPRPCGPVRGRQRTTSVCYSSHVRSCGSGDSGLAT